MLDLLLKPEIWLSLFTLTAIEIVLGIDNLVFISVITASLRQRLQKPARRVGLLLACVTRLILLATVVWLTKLTYTVFSLFGYDFSWRDLLLIGGGLFLLIKGTSEIHVSVTEQGAASSKPKYANFALVVIQIMFLDIVFSLDSVIVAVGLTQEFFIMAIAIITAVLLMLLASEPISRFIKDYPTLKMLALSFLLLIGVALIADGLKFHIPRGYIYFAITFSIFVEVLNILIGRRGEGNKSNS